jgi:hypothetical protein
MSGISLRRCAVAGEIEVWPFCFPAFAFYYECSIWQRLPITHHNLGEELRGYA